MLEVAATAFALLIEPSRLVFLFAGVLIGLALGVV